MELQLKNLQEQKKEITISDIEKIEGGKTERIKVQKVQQEKSCLSKQYYFKVLRKWIVRVQRRY